MLTHVKSLTESILVSLMMLSKFKVVISPLLQFILGDDDIITVNFVIL